MEAGGLAPESQAEFLPLALAGPHPPDGLVPGLMHQGRGQLCSHELRLCFTWPVNIKRERRGKVPLNTACCVSS